MNEWIPIDKKLPRHATHVLALTVKGAMAVVIYIDNKTAMNELRMKGVDVPKSEDVGFSFCSQEKNGETVNGVTHWQYLPKAP
jgi:hypothetical protein